LNDVIIDLSTNEDLIALFEIDGLQRILESAVIVISRMGSSLR